MTDKKRVALEGRGKQGGARTLLAYRIGKKHFLGSTQKTEYKVR